MQRDDNKPKAGLGDVSLACAEHRECVRNAMQLGNSPNKIVLDCCDSRG